MVLLKTTEITEIISELMAQVGVHVENHNISVSHRLNSNIPGKPKPIIVKFTSRHIRNKVFSAKGKFKTKDVSKFTGNNHLFVYENLTSYRKRLFKQAKEEARKCKYSFMWTKGCDIFVKKMNNQ